MDGVRGTGCRCVPRCGLRSRSGAGGDGAGRWGVQPALVPEIAQGTAVNTMSVRLRPRGVSRDETPWIPRAGDSMGVRMRSIQLPVLILFYFPDFRGLVHLGGLAG